MTGTVTEILRWPLLCLWHSHARAVRVTTCPGVSRLLSDQDQASSILRLARLLSSHFLVLTVKISDKILTFLHVTESKETAD